MCTVLYACALCSLYLSKNSVYECLRNINSIPHTKNKFSTLKNKTKLGKQCTMCTVHIQFVKKQWVRMFRKLKFNPAHQKSALYLEKQKVGKTVQNVHCAVQQWQVRSDSAIQTACSKEPYTENFRKISCFRLIFFEFEVKSQSLFLGLSILCL